jgi:hypothetical protein
MNNFGKAFSLVKDNPDALEKIPWWVYLGGNAVGTYYMRKALVTATESEEKAYWISVGSTFFYGFLVFKSLKDTSKISATISGGLLGILAYDLLMLRQKKVEEIATKASPQKRQITAENNMDGYEEAVRMGRVQVSIHDIPTNIFVIVNTLYRVIYRYYTINGKPFARDDRISLKPITLEQFKEAMRVAYSENAEITIVVDTCKCNFCLERKVCALQKDFWKNFRWFCFKGDAEIDGFLAKSYETFFAKLEAK